MSGNGPIKIVAVIAVILVVVVGGVAVSLIDGKKNDSKEEPDYSYAETTRGSYSGSLPFGEEPSETTAYETYTFNIDESTVMPTVKRPVLSTKVQQTQAVTPPPVTRAPATRAPATRAPATRAPAPVVTSAPTVTSLYVSSKPNKTSYYAGDSFSTAGLKVIAEYSDGSSKDVTSSVIISTPDMYSNGNQTVNVTYTENGKRKDTSFNISISTPSISLSYTELSLNVGEYLYLTATTTPSDRTVSWSSSAPDVASVTSNGKVSALKEGISAITASFQYGSVTYSETCLLIVKVEEPQSSTLEVHFYDGTYDNDEDTLYLCDLEGTVSSNYNIEYVEVGIIGPVYVNGTLQEIDQSETYKRVHELETTEITLQQLAELYGGEFYFDIVTGEEYIVYVYAEDASGATNFDYFNMIFTVDEI